MIWLKWEDPNFEFRAVDKHGKPEQHCCYAKSEPELRQRLEEKGLTVIEVKKYDFGPWKKRAEAAKLKAIAAHLANMANYKGNVPEYNKKKKAIKFKAAIWSELKWHLFSLSHDKCAYCESKVRHVDYGDVEHFRPKSKVDEDPQRTNDPGHPGYYWLAYDYTNLLPSCGLCNKSPGKVTHFPVVGVHARDAAGLASEQPLLLNPYNPLINPFDHLEFNQVGEALPHKNSPYGENSAKYCRLNRHGIGEQRQIAISKVQRDWSALIGIYSSFIDEARRQYWDEVLTGIREYSAAQRWELHRITSQGGI